MFLTNRRIVLIGVIGAIVLTIIFLPQIAFYANAPDVDQITISLSDVAVSNILNNTKNVELRVTFDIHNPSDKSATTSKIEYELFGNDKSLGNGILSFEDIPLNGRPQFSPDTTKSLDSLILLTPMNSNMDIIDQLINNQSNSEFIDWSTHGTIQLESAFIATQKTFNDEL